MLVSGDEPESDIERRLLAQRPIPLIPIPADWLRTSTSIVTNTTRRRATRNSSLDAALDVTPVLNGEHR
jgi:hypothetical protein